MDNELEIDLSTEEPQINRTEERIKNLSSKVKDTAKERDEAKAAAEAAEAARVAAEKERDFYAGFAGHATKYPGASEHIDAIKEKVLAGYDPEDAVVAVLSKEGKLQPQAEVAPIVGPAAGGSALTNIQAPATNLTREEMRQKLIEADASGDLAEAIRTIR